jgi:glycine/D-amino acid oxidase-like deaminating enzyme
MVVPGFQVPLENLERNAYDYQSNDDSIHSLPSIIRSIQSFFGIPDSAPRYSKAVVQELYNATYVALYRLRDIVKRYEIDCDWVESGAVEASIHAVEEKDEEETEEETDYGSRVLTPQQVDQIIGRQSATNDPNDKDSLLYQWGEYDPKCAGVDPLALTVGLANAVEQWGVKIYENAKVAKLDHNPQSSDRSSQGRFALTTKEGNVIHCDHVVLCTGAEAGLSKRLSNSFIPIYTWMAATEPLHNKCPLTKEAAESVLGSVDQTEMKQPFSVAAAPMCGDDHFALNYWRNDNKEDGRLLFGSLCDTYAFPSSFIAWRLRHALSEVYPHLSNVRFDHVWGGKLAVALHGMPIIGRDINYDNDNTIQSEGGVWYNTGFSGHGIVPTALAGSVIANGILGIPDRESNDMHQMQLWQLFHTHFPPLMWNGYPFSRVGAGAVFLVYNLFDWLGKRGVPVPKLLPEIW